MVYLFLSFFMIGTIFGSFYYVVAYRVPKGESIIYPPSHCPNCNHKLSFWDMIPILSYIFLGGKCRYCKQKIRIRYLLLEITTGLAFLLFALSLKMNG